MGGFYWYSIFMLSPNRSTDLGLARGSSTSAGPSVLPRMAPPVPPRQVQQSYRPSYSSFSQSYSPYGSSIYGGYSPYSYGYGGGYGGGYSLGGYRHTPHLEDVPPSRFVQQAEESSRGAFESIESIVHAFASISMMMDATFSALHNGFRAVLEVVNHVTRLRVHLTRVLSKFALVRTLHYLYRLVQKLLGRRLDPEVEALWPNPSEATGMRSSREMEDQAVKSWPILMFFALVLGVPYLIWKLSSTADSEIKGKACRWNSKHSHIHKDTFCFVVCSTHVKMSLLVWHHVPFCNSVANKLGIIAPYAISHFTTDSTKQVDLFLIKTS